MLLKTFSRTVSCLYRNGFPGKVGVALSGGVDSMCLLYLLQKYITSNKIIAEIYPITINHNLREESSLEVVLIRQRLKELNLQDNHLTADLHFTSKDSAKPAFFEKVARLKRYKAFFQLCKDHGIEDVFLGHHLDDQIETFTMRLLKNSGVFGLDSMSYMSKSLIPSSNPINIARPMLQIPKDDIYKFCFDNKIEWCQDLSNFEQIAIRNIIRSHLKEHTALKVNLENNYKKVRTMNFLLNRQIDDLYSQTMKQNQLSHCGSKYSINLTKDQLEKYSDLVITRFIFKLLYPVSPSNHYAYRYQKLLKNANLIREGGKFCLSMLEWESKVVKNGILLSVVRQPPLRHTSVVRCNVNCMPGSWSDWVLFDNVYWFRFYNGSNVSRSYSIKLLADHDRSKLTSDLKRELPNNFKMADYRGLPVVIDDRTKEYFSLPTAVPNPNCDWRIKDNIYSFDSPIIIQSN